MRIFLAFPIPEAIRNEAANVASLVRKKYPYLEAKWALPVNMHVTIEFLGSLTDKQLQVVKDCLMYQTKKVAPFCYRALTITAFPNVHHPDTIVITVGEADTAFSVLLRKAIHEELSLFNLSRDFKLWRPHITLARVKNPGEVAVTDCSLLPLPNLEWKVDRLELIESKLTTHGAQYCVLEQFPLG